MRTKISKINKIDKIVNKAQKSLRLSSYKIRCFLRKDMKNCEYAEIIYDIHRKNGIINLNPRKLNDDLKDTIIHELLHLFFDKYLGVAENVFERHKRFKSLKKYRKGEENAIRILASLLKRGIFQKN